MSKTAKQEPEIKLNEPEKQPAQKEPAEKEPAKKPIKGINKFSKFKRG